MNTYTPPRVKPSPSICGFCGARYRRFHGCYFHSEPMPTAWPWTVRAVASLCHARNSALRTVQIAPILGLDGHYANVTLARVNRLMDYLCKRTLRRGTTLARG